MRRCIALLTCMLVGACGGSGNGSGDGSLDPPPPTPPPTPPPEPAPLALSEVAAGVIDPVHVTHAGDGSGRLFVVSQPGRIHVIAADAARPVEQPPVFLDIVGNVNDSFSERGLLSVAFPPDFAERQYFYVNYTAQPDGRTVISRFFVSDSDPDSAIAGSEEVLLEQPQPGTNHNGGLLKFGADGYLYAGFGDGGPDPGQSQDGSTWLGALLRLDTEDVDPAFAFAIPPDNPFVDDPSTDDAIWATGLRNPWRFSFDRATGDLYIADVGQSSREEINFQAADSPGGENYGWPVMEGTLCYQPSTGCDTQGLTLPVHEYGHAAGDRAVTGGYVYRGSAIPDLQGVYVYGDYLSGRMWGLRRNGDDWSNELLLETSRRLSSFGEDEDGELYVTDYANGRVLRLGAPQAQLEGITN